MPPIHSNLETFCIMVTVIVRDAGKVQQLRELLRTSVVKVDGEQAIGRLYNYSHIVKIPYRRLVQILHHGMTHLVKHLGKRFFKPADRRISAFDFT